MQAEERCACLQHQCHACDHAFASPCMTMIGILCQYQTPSRGISQWLCTNSEHLYGIHSCKAAAQHTSRSSRPSYTPLAMASLKFASSSAATALPLASPLDAASRPTSPHTVQQQTSVRRERS
eukprot:76297-Chlamydomonas_euryale.AAC.10